MAWDPAQYERFRRERAQPFHDLLSRVPDGSYRTIADLGCGTGELTRHLKDRWPEARVFGVDNSPEMLAGARRTAGAGPTPEKMSSPGVPGLSPGPTPPSGDGIEFIEADLMTWSPPAPLDLVFSNAAIHWIPDQEALVAHLVRIMAPGGVLAVQAPNNREEVAYRILTELLAEPPWRERLAGAPPQPRIESPHWYLEALRKEQCDVTLWETIYHHAMPDAAAIVEWVKGTTLRPVLAELTEGEAAEFVGSLTERVAGAYPETEHGVIFPFKRLFFVARKEGQAASLAPLTPSTTSAPLPS